VILPILRVRRQDNVQGNVAVKAALDRQAELEASPTAWEFPLQRVPAVATALVYLCAGAAPPAPVPLAPRVALWSLQGFARHLFAKSI
jgi:hypothetical protein